MSIYVALVLVAIWVLGPRPKVRLRWNEKASRFALPEELHEIKSAELRLLRQRIDEFERAVPKVIDGTEKAILFSSEARPKRTSYVVLYVHGFSASRQEVSPVAENLAKALHANFYATRLTGHGQDGDALADAKSGDWLFDMVEAWHVARQLGEKVIVMATSTGGSLVTWMAQQEAVKPHLAGIILISPNYQPKHWATPLFLWPWSRYWLPKIGSGMHGWQPDTEAGAKYWTYRYPVSAVHNLTALVKAVRASDLEAIEAPTLFLYSYHDRIVNARVTDAAFRRWGAKVKHHIAVPAAETGNNHVVLGDIVAPDKTEALTRDILTFVKSHVVSGE